MRPVGRDEIVDYATYEDDRPAFRAAVMKLKSVRRVHLGPQVTLLFENTLTVRYQIQEMMRVERIVREADVRREIETYNEILGGDGELGCTLMVEIEDPTERRQKLQRWMALPEHVYALLADDTRVRPRFDARQRGDDRLSAVQFLAFAVGGRLPIAFGVDLPGLAIETRLSGEQRAALTEDLAGPGG